jgi:hypothetical protein
MAETKRVKENALETQTDKKFTNADLLVQFTTHKKMASKTSKCTTHFGNELFIYFE